MRFSESLIRLIHCLLFLVHGCLSLVDFVILIVSLCEFIFVGIISERMLQDLELKVCFSG